MYLVGLRRKGLPLPSFCDETYHSVKEKIEQCGQKLGQPVRYWKDVSLCGEEVVAGVQVHRVVNIK